MRVRTTTRRARIGGCCVVALGWLLACTEFKPGDVLPDSGSACTHAEPPPRPKASRSSVRSEREYVFATRDQYLGETDGPDGKPLYKNLGYDLDRTCTGQGEGPSCQQPAWGGAVVSDGNDGRDGSGNAIFYQAVVLGLDVGKLVEADRDAESGRATLVMRLRGYNGKDDDDRVEVEVYSATLWPSHEAGPKPAWDGQDAWRPTSPWLEPRDPEGDTAAARFRDPDAYVAGGTVVAHLDTLRIGSAFVYTATWSRVVISARLEQAADGLMLRDGIMTGAWPIDMMLELVAHEVVDDPYAPACKNDPLGYQAMRGAYCDRVDLSTVAGDPSAPCDALSVAIGFTALPAQLGEPLAIPESIFADCGVVDCNGVPLMGTRGAR